MIIYQRTKFSAAHRLLNYNGSCANLHGHTWEVEIWIEGDSLDKCGMLRDYRDVKGYIKERFDHRTILNKDDPLMAMTSTLGKVTSMEDNPTAENLAALIRGELGAARVKVHESEDNYAEAWA